MTEDNNNAQPLNNDEIDLIALAKTVWDGRKIIIKCIILFMVFGLTVALLTPNEYTATTTMIPQVSSSSTKLGGLSSLAAMAGFNINMNQAGNEISPMLYPQIISSIPFQLEIMNTKFHFPNTNQKVSLFKFYTEIKEPGLLQNIKKYSFGLPFMILKWIKGEKLHSENANLSNNLITLTEEQEGIRELLDETIQLEVNDKDGYLSLSVNSFNAELSAQIAQKALSMLQEHITQLKIEKTSAQLDFIQERYNENKRIFETAQNRLADFQDKNKNVTTAHALTEKEKLQREYQLAYNVFSELAQQLEQAKIQVKEDTPVFSIIKPVTVPSKKTGPKRSVMLVVWTFLGGIIGVGWIFGKEFLKNIKEQWNETTTLEFKNKSFAA